MVETPTPVPTKSYGPVPPPRDLVAWELGLATDLHRAVLDGNLEAIKDLIDEGLDLEAEAQITFPEGNPPPNSPLLQWFELTYALRPLHLAAWVEGPEVVALLLDAGADIDARGGEWNALYFALAHNPNPATVALLLDRDSNLNPTSSATETPLHQAARFNTNPAIVELLLDRDVTPVNAHSNYGGTPLHQAAWHNPNHEVVELLLSRGADANSPRNGGYTPLHMAAYNPNPLVAQACSWMPVQRLMDWTMECPKLPCRWRPTTFEPGVTQVLLDAGADTEFNYGLPLRNAVLNRNLAVATALLDGGADIDARRDEYMRTPLHISLLNILTTGQEVEDELERELAVLELLLDRGADMTTEFSGAIPLESIFVPPDRSHYSEAIPIAIKMMLDRGADPNGNPDARYASIHQAAAGQSVEIMQLLFDAGADVHVRTNQGETALHFAVRHLNPDYVNGVITWLLDAGLDIETETEEGETACDIVLARGIYRPNRSSGP